MENSIIEEGKTSTEAIEKGLRKLNCRREDVDIKIIENEEKRSFYSILEPRVVKVELTLKKDIESRKNIEKPERKEKNRVVTADDIKKCSDNLNEFLNKFFEKIDNTEYQLTEDDNSIKIEISGEGSKDLIGYRGETIKSMQTLFSSIGNKNTENRVSIVVDIGDYNEKRKNTLIGLARKLEKTVRKNGKKIILEPMSSYERKIIHTELQNSEYVTTYSIGEEPRRKIVIEKKLN